jgi:hypothetical protein
MLNDIVVIYGTPYRLNYTDGERVWVSNPAILEEELVFWVSEIEDHRRFIDRRFENNEASDFE